MPPRRKAVKPAERNRDDFLWSIDAFLDRTFDLPDIIEFALSDAYLGRNLYPAQGTMLKIWALQDELFTQFDYDLIGEWTDSFSQTRDNGTQPDILERIKICKAEGRPWFREWINILGRRGAKGYVGAMAGSYVLWHYIAMGDPHAYFGLDRDKPLAMLVFAGKKDQAITNQWGDLNNVITGAPCFVPYLPQRTLMKEALYVYAPHDFIRIQDRQDMGVMVNVDTMASFQILPKESTLLSARGPAVFCEMFDEMAHITRETANVSADELWTQATPALDTFHEKAFIYEGSSPWQMIGQFYENAQQAVAISDGLDGFPQGTILRPEIFLLQLESWRPYEAWDRSHEIPLRPEGKEKPHATVFPKQRQAVQEYDDQMRRLEAANPETFSVERRCLDPETRVLGTDLRWYPIKDLRVGQQLITLDEEGETAGFDAHPTRKKRERKLRVGVVEAMNQVIDRAYRIGFEDGTSVICSGRHRWLASTKGSPNYQRWASIESCSARGPRSVLKVGDAIRGVVEPWEELDGEEALKAAYLAGAYDGEGSICNRNRLRTEFRIDFTQNPGTVLDTVLDLLHDLKFNPRSSGSKKKAQQYKITGLGEGLRFLGQIRPLRLLENAAPSSRNSGFWEGRALGHENGKRLCKVIVQIDANKGRVSKRKGKKFGPLSIDTRNKISKANSGKKRSEETKIKLSNFHKGKLKSEETKNKIKQTKTENPYRHSEEKKKEIGNKSKGRTAWNKGKPMSEESKRKLSIANIGKPGPNKGKPMSEESKRKQSETQLAKHFKHSEETKEKIRRKKLKL